MTGYEVGYQLLIQMILFVSSVKYPFEFVKHAERWFAHHFQHFAGSMFRSYLQSARYVIGYQFLHIFSMALVYFLISNGRQQQVVTDAAANKRFFDFRQRVNGVIKIEQ